LSSRHPLFKAYVALAACCFFWGTTYLGIRMALESFPPFKLVCTRFLISGAIVVAYAFSRGHYLPKGRDLATVCFNGLLTLGVGNSAVVFAETRIPSGIAGLLITISPFWMVGVEALRSCRAARGCICRRSPVWWSDSEERRYCSRPRAGSS
jgi:drug/metabolite transporter (DMT)-like permease